MEGDPRNPKMSLLKKYDIPIEHLSYEYVEKCTNKKELERMVRILRSGEEGCYPDLLKVTEDRLRIFAPDSRALRYESPILTKESLPKEEWKAVERELLCWEKEMAMIDKSLDFEKERRDIVGSKKMPSIREVQHESKPKPNERKCLSNSKNERIKSGDYAAWDKFDVDKALLKIDVEEEKKEEQNQKKKRELKKSIAEKKIEVDLDKDSYSTMEQQILANQSKERGNECYKSGDLENALKYYNLSIKLHSTTNAFNNRAMTYIKLKQYENAINDCNVVLGNEKDNIKALHRRATAYQNIASDSNNFNMLALEDLTNVVLLEPNNKVAQSDLQKLKVKLGIHDEGKKFRMPIYESDVYSNSQVKDNKIRNLTKSFTTIKDLPQNIEKLPLTYYGPSTSSFQCEPYSMAHRALSCSLSSTEVMCKCNSSLPRQNPLCQKCGEAMCRPKNVPKDFRKIKKEANKKACNDALNKIQKLDFEKNDKIEIEQSLLKKLNISKTSKEMQNEVAAISTDINKLETRKTNPLGDLEKVPNTNLIESQIIRNSGICENEGGMSKVNNSLGIENDGKEINENSRLPNDCKTEEIKLKESRDKNKNTEVASVPGYMTANVREASQVVMKSGKHKSKKKKSGEQQPKGEKKKQLDLIEPSKVVHAAKYLQPTSVEVKVRKEVSEKPQPEISLLKTNQFKTFVPNRQCLSIRQDESLTGSHLNSMSPRKSCLLSHESVSSNTFDIIEGSSREGNKENFLSRSENTNDISKDCNTNGVKSAFEFIKTWEEVKKLDANYSKRAEIIRSIRPMDLGEVIGIKLDSDMLSSILECLERQFVDSEPKVVVEFLKQLPQIPRFGLIKMFLADADKKIMRNLIKTTESKGFVLEEDVKKDLVLTS